MDSQQENKVDNKFLEQYLKQSESSRSDATATRFSPVQRLREKNKSGNFNYADAAIAKSEAESAEKRRKEREIKEERRRKKEAAEKAYQEASERRRRKENEYWNHKQTEEEIKLNEEIKENREKKLKDDEAAYTRRFIEWAGEQGYDVNDKRAMRRARVRFGLINEIGSMGTGSIDAHISDLNGRIGDIDIDINAAEAHKQMMDLQATRKGLYQQYEDAAKTLNVNRGREGKIRDEDRQKFEELQGQIASLDQIINDNDLQQLDKMFKYDWAKQKGLTGGFWQNVGDAFRSTATILPSQSEAMASSIRQQRLDEAAGLYDKNVVRDYYNQKPIAPIINNEKELNEFYRTGQIYNSDNRLNKAMALNPEKQPKNDTEVELKQIDNYIKKKKWNKAEYNADIIATEKFRQNLDRNFKVCDEYKKLMEDSQDESIFSKYYWHYVMPNMIGSSNSSPEQIAANAIQTAGLFAGPAGYYGSALISVPLQLKGGESENYAETSEKRLDNLKSLLFKEENQEIMTDIMDDLKNQSVKYWKNAGMSDEWIKEHTEGSNAENNILTDLTSGAVKNNSPLITQALMNSTKGLRAMRTADNVRTLWETGTQLTLQFMPLDKVLSKGFGLLRKGVKKAVALRSAKGVEGRINAAVESAAENSAGRGASRYSNGYNRNTVLDSFKKGYEAGSSVGESMGLGGPGSIIAGTVTGSTRAAGHMLKKIDPELGKWANSIEESLMFKYQKVIDKLTPESTIGKLATRYGVRVAKKDIASRMSEASEEAVQYLNSKKDFAKLYGYDGMDFGEAIINDFEQGKRVANAYLSLLGLTNSELKNDKEFWNNAKGGFALGSFNPGVSQFVNVYRSASDVVKEYKASQAILSNGVVSREVDRLNRAANVEFAKEAMNGRGDVAIQVLDGLRESDSRRENPNFSQEDYEDKIQDARGIVTLTNNQDVREMLEGMGIKYGSHRYAVAVADLYSLNQQRKANMQELIQNQASLNQLYNGEEFSKKIDEFVENVTSDPIAMTRMSQAQAEAGEKAVKKAKEDDEKNGVDTTTDEYKAHLDEVRKHAHDDYAQRYKQNAKNSAITVVRQIAKANALLRLIAQSNSISDVFDYIERKTGLKTKRPDAKIVDDSISKQLQQLKKDMSNVFKDLNPNATDEQFLQYIQKLQQQFPIDTKQFEDLELAGAMIQADGDVINKYTNHAYGKNNNKNYPRRVDAIIKANEENERINWMVSDIYSGDAINKLNDIIDDEEAKETAEEAKKRAEAEAELKKKKAAQNPVDNATAPKEDLSSKLAKNKQKYRERIEKAKENYRKRRGKINGKRLHMEIIPVTAFANLANDLFYIAEGGAYKFQEFVENVKDILESGLDKQSLQNARKAYITASAKFKLKHPELAENLSSAEEVMSYVEQDAPTTITQEPVKLSKSIIDALEENQKYIDKDLSTYYDTIVTRNGVTEIYKNAQEIRLRGLDKPDHQIYGVINQLKLANISEQSFKDKLVELGVSPEYAKYRNVDGIYDTVARAWYDLQQNKIDSLKQAIAIRSFVIACFNDDVDGMINSLAEIDSPSKDKENVANKIIEMAQAVKRHGLTVISTNYNIYGKNQEGNRISSTLDLLFVDGDGNIHVVDVLNSFTSIHKGWNVKINNNKYTIEERENALLHQLQDILQNDYRAKLVGLSVLPVVSNEKEMYAEDRINIPLHKTLDVDLNEAIDSINETIDQYNELEQQCKDLGIQFQKIESYKKEQVVDSEKLQYIRQLSQKQDSIRDMIDQIRSEISKRSNAGEVSESYEYQFLANENFDQLYPASDEDSIRMLMESCAEIDSMMNQIPAVAPVTQEEKDALDLFFYYVQQAQDALNEVLKSGAKIDVRQEEELISSAMEMIVSNREYYGTKAVEVAKWWLTKFSLQGEEDNNTEKSIAKQVALNQYYDTISSWIETLREHVLNDIEDDTIMQAWYSILLNNYFKKLLNNADAFADQIINDKAIDSTVDINMPVAVKDIVKKGLQLINFYNQEFSIDPSEIFPDMPQDEVEAINRIPIIHRTHYVPKSRSYSPAFDKMKGSPQMDQNSRNWAMIFQKMSIRPDFLDNITYFFEDFGDDVKVCIKYKNPTTDKEEFCYLPFLTDINSYPPGALSKAQVREIKSSNRHKKAKFIPKIKAMLNYMRAHRGWKIECKVSTNKGSLIYSVAQPDGRREMYSVEDFLFKNNHNAKNLYDITTSIKDEIGFLVISKDSITGADNYDVRCGEGLKNVIRSFDPQYMKGVVKFGSGSILYNYNTGNGQKIPALIDRAPIGDDSEKLVKLIIDYVNGNEKSEGYSILDLLKMRLYIDDPNRRITPYNNERNLIKIDRVEKTVTIGSEAPIRIDALLSNNKDLIQRIAAMPNVTNNSMMNQRLGSSSNNVISSVRSLIAVDPNVSSVTLPNGLTFEREDFTYQNVGSTWFGYMLRNNLLQTPVMGMSYKQVNFEDPKLVKINQDTNSNVVKAAENVGQTTTKTALDILQNAWKDGSGLAITVDQSELADRSDDETEQFRQTAFDYFDQVFGSHQDVEVLDNVQSSIIGGKVAAGYCAAQMVALAKNAPDSAIFHEAFHKVMELVLPESQREYFYSTYRSKFGEDLSDREVAEGLCDMFTDFMQHKMQVKRAKGMGKIYQWFRKLAFNIGMVLKIGVQNTIKFHTLYSDINKGVYKNKEVSQKNIDRFNSIFATNSDGVARLYYTVETPGRVGGSVNLEHIQNNLEFHDLIRSIGFLAGSAYNFLSPDADPQKIRIDENLPNVIDKWLKSQGGNIATLSNFHEAFGEIFEASVEDYIDEDGKKKAKVTYPKFNAIYKYVADYMSTILGDYRGKFKLEDEDSDQDEKAMRQNIDKFDRASYEFSKLDSTTDKVKFFFATIPYRDKDGNLDTSKNLMNAPCFMPLEEVYNVIINDMHEATSIEDLKERMRQKQNKSPMHAYVYQKFMKLTDGMYTYDEDGSIVNIDYDKEAFAINILSLVRSQKLDFIVALSTKDSSGGKTISIKNAQNNRDAIAYPKQWTSFLLSGQIPIFNRVRDDKGNLMVRPGKQNVFRDTAAFFRNLIVGIKQNEFTIDGVTYNTQSNEDLERLKQEIVNKLYGIGIIMPKAAIEHMLQQKYSTDDYSGDSFEGIRDWLEHRENSSIYAFLSRLEQFVSESGKVNQELVQNGYNKVGFVTDLGNALGDYNRITTQQMVLALNNKKLYSVSQNNSISHVVNAINTLSLENSVVQTLINYDYNLFDTNDIKSGSIVLKELMKNNSNLHLQLHTFIGMKTDNRGDTGTEYTDEATVDDFMSKMAMLQNGMIISPTLADKGTWVAMSGIKLPGLTFDRVAVKYDSNNNPVEWGTKSNGAPTLQFVGKDYIIRPSDAVLDQMLEYAKSERIAIQQCMEDLGYDNIPGYTSGSRTKLPEEAKIKNYHTPNKDKASGKVIEPNGTRFLTLTQVVTGFDKDGKPIVVNLNNPNKSSVELLKLANDTLFEQKDGETPQQFLDRQRNIMAYTLHIQQVQAVKKAEKLGIIEHSDLTMSNAKGEQTVIRSKDDKSSFLNITSSHLNNQQIEALAGQFFIQLKLGDSDAYKAQAYRDMCRSLAIVAILGDITNKSIMSTEEFKRLFMGNPAFFKVNYDVKNGIIKDSTFDIQKRIGGLISTGDDNDTDLPLMSSTYTCAECKDYEVGLDEESLKSIGQDFENSAVREMYAIVTGDWIGAYDLEWEKLNEEISKLSKGEQARIEKARVNAKRFTDSYKDGINVADGASYITADMCRDMLRMRGAFNGRVKKAFEILTDESSKYTWGDREDAFEVIYDAVNIVPTKYTAYGMRQHTLGKGSDVIEQQSDLAVPYYNKFALFPLFPCLATGKMAGIYEKMQNEGVDMLLMDSAVKVGSQAPVKYDGNVIEKPFNKYTQEFSFLRRQLNTDPEEGSKIAIGTQMVKIVLQSLRLDRMYDFNGTKISGRQMRDMFMHNISTISSLGEQKIIEKFFTDGKVDQVKLSKYFKDQLGSKNANAQVSEAIELKETSEGIETNYPLAATTSSSWIEAIMIATVNGDVIDINTPGSSFVQRSVFAIESEDGEGSIQGVNYYHGQKLKMINDKGSMDSVISIDYFESILPKGLSFTQARQWLIDNKIIGTDADATTIGYRIPTQAQSSIHALRFIDVLPATKTTIILPTEFTKITGSDFDIDHLYLALYNYAINEDKETGVRSASRTEGLDEMQQAQNNLIDCMMSLLKDTKNSMHSLYKSIDNDTDIPKSLADIVPSSESEKHLPFNFGTLHEQVERKNDYINGKNGIGPFALNVTNQILTFLYNVAFANSAFTKNTPIKHLHYITDSNGDYISAWLSAFINAHVDIVKDPWVVKLNVNPFTYNTINLLVRSGVGEAGVWLLTQPVIKDLAEVEDKVKSEFLRDPGVSKSKYRLKLVGEVLDKYNIPHSDDVIRSYTTSGNKNDIDKRINVVNYVLLHNTESFKEQAIGKSNVDNELQKNAYYAFLALQQYAQALSNLVSYTKIDTRKHGKSLIQICKYLSNYNELFHPIDDSKSMWDMESLHNLIYGSWIEQKTKTAIRLPMQILSNQVYNANSEFIRAVTHFARIVSPYSTLNDDTMNTISKHLQTALKSRFMVRYAQDVLGRTNNDIRTIFFGDKHGNYSIAKRLNALKFYVMTDPRYSRLKGNSLLEKLRPVEVEDDTISYDGNLTKQPEFITIDSNVDGSKINEDDVMRSWQELLTDQDQNVRRFAEDLIIYTFFTSGEYSGWNKLFKYVPPAWIEGKLSNFSIQIDGIQCSSYGDYIKGTLNGNIPSLESMFDDVVANNFFDYNICTEIKYKDQNGRPNFVTDTDQPVIAAQSVLFGADVPVYISVKKNGAEMRRQDMYNIYKLVGYIPSHIRDQYYPIYCKLPKKGYQQQGGNAIYEYGFSLGYGFNDTPVSHDFLQESFNNVKTEINKARGIKVVWKNVQNYLNKVYNHDIIPVENDVQEEPIQKQQVEPEVVKSETENGIKYYHVPYTTSSGIKVKHSAVRSFIEALNNAEDEILELPLGNRDGKRDPNRDKSKDVPMSYSITYRSLKENESFTYYDYAEFVNEFKWYICDDFNSGREEYDYPVSFHYNQQTKSYETSSKALYDIVKLFMDNAGLEELVCEAVTEWEHYKDVYNRFQYDMSDVFNMTGGIQYLIDAINHSIQNGVLKPQVMTAGGYNELFQEESLSRALEQSDIYEIFSEEEMKKGEQNKKNCKGK